MHFEASVLTLAAGTFWHRIQLLKPRKGSVRIRGLMLPPAGVLSGRFDLAEATTAYFADSEATALYETEFRREAEVASFARLTLRALVCFKAINPLRLADVRRLGAPYPVLQSRRMAHTRAMATRWHEDGLDGVLYASAQHPSHDCLCLFPPGFQAVRRVSVVALVEAGTERFHRAVLEAANGAFMPVVR